MPEKHNTRESKLDFRHVLIIESSLYALCTVPYKHVTTVNYHVNSCF